LGGKRRTHVSKKKERAGTKLEEKKKGAEFNTSLQEKRGFLGKKLNAKTKKPEKRGKRQRGKTKVETRRKEKKKRTGAIGGQGRPTKESRGQNFL